MDFSCFGYHPDLESRLTFQEKWVLAAAFNMITTNAAQALGLRDYGVAKGAAADFVVLDAQHVQEAVVARPRPRDVYKNGRLVAHGGTIVTAAR
ncbi:amidohydrolase family protein [Bradyrhizobium elkanii]|uniref:amidohydrolase family protein n=1 Tax=Bradyrhizobium elkanii TaxID=29448 RepID=UPI0030BA033C